MSTAAKDKGYDFIIDRIFHPRQRPTVTASEAALYCLHMTTSHPLLA